MDKQKEIEEITNMLEDFRTNRLACSCEYLANKIYDKLIPQDSVVISKEEYEKLKTDNEVLGVELERTSTLLVNASKETSEKILKWLTSKRHLFNRTYEVGFKKPITSYLVFNDEIEELAKQFGVDLKE